MTTSTSKINPKTREGEFPGEFRAMNNTLMYIYCNHEVDWVKKSTMKDHIKSQKHIDCKLRISLIYQK